MAKSLKQSVESVIDMLRGKRSDPQAPVDAAPVAPEASSSKSQTGEDQSPSEAAAAPAAKAGTKA